MESNPQRKMVSNICGNLNICQNLNICRKPQGKMVLKRFVEMSKSDVISAASILFRMSLIPGQFDKLSNNIPIHNIPIHIGETIKELKEVVNNL